VSLHCGKAKDDRIWSITAWLSGIRTSSHFLDQIHNYVLTLDPDKPAGSWTVEAVARMVCCGSAI
jgi:hypothetical protein